MHSSFFILKQGGNDEACNANHLTKECEAILHDLCWVSYIYSLITVVLLVSCCGVLFVCWWWLFKKNLLANFCQMSSLHMSVKSEIDKSCLWRQHLQRCSILMGFYKTGYSYILFEDYYKIFNKSLSPRVMWF